MLPHDIDGVNQWPSIVEDFPSPRTEILLNIDDVDNVEAIRKGKFKLVKGTPENGTRDQWYDKEGRPFNASYSLRTLQHEKLYTRVNFCLISSLFFFVNHTKASICFLIFWAIIYLLKCCRDRKC